MNEKSKYDKLWENEWKSLHKIGPSVRSRYRMLIKLIEKYKCTGPLIDLGGGDGTFLFKLYQTFQDKFRYDIADISTRALNSARKYHFIDNFYEINLLEEKSLPTKRYKVAICAEVLEHMRDWKVALNNVTKLIQAEGYLFVTVPHGQKFWSQHDDFAHHYRRFEKGEIEEYLKAQNWEIKESICWGWPFYWLYYAIVLNNIDPSRSLSKEMSKWKIWISKILNNLFHVDDLFNTRNGRRLFIVAQKN
jgi:2-polyprenyl-3-methyl-5-hydroxy-6-metoxy-1,4-benzoquinol methylase